MLEKPILVALCSLGDIDRDRIPDLAVLTWDRLCVVEMAERRVRFAIDSPVKDTETEVGVIGRALAAIGDVDGDGRTELAVAWSSRVRGGRVHLSVHSTRDGQALWWMDDAGEFESVLAAPGDLDGDGVPDLLVGAPGHSVPTGRVEARSGRDGRKLHEIEGELRWSKFGCSIAPLGDIDADGRPDYAVGAPGPGNSGPRQEGPQPIDAERRFGAVHMISGGTGERIRIIYGTHVMAEDGHGFGSVLASGGDFDRDGVHDLVVGQGNGGYSTRPRQQRVLVLSGQSGALVLEIAREGSAADQYGEALVVLGDRTGDGVPEILVGVPEWNLGDRPGELREVNDVGAAEIVDGANGSPNLIWTGEETFDALGQHVARVGDLACIASSERIFLLCWKAGSILGTICLDSLDEPSGR